MTTHDIDALIARLKGVGCNVPIADEAADALQQQAERITAQDVKCRLYEASLAKADAEIDGLRETINSPDAMASARAVNALLTAEIEELKRERDVATTALESINTIRNSIVGLQTLNWSEHVYPLVAALDAAGLTGMEYPESREFFGTMLDRCNASEDDAARYRWLRDWYLRDGLRAEIHPLGHIIQTTALIIDEAIDAALSQSTEAKNG